MARFFPVRATPDCGFTPIILTQLSSISPEASVPRWAGCSSTSTPQWRPCTLRRPVDPSPCRLLTLGRRYKSGSFIDIALDVLSARNSRDLEVSERSPAFRKLESYFKKLSIKLMIGGVERKRTIKGLVPEAGNFMFSKDGMMTRVAVSSFCCPSMTLEHITFKNTSRTTSQRRTICQYGFRRLSVSWCRRRVQRALLFTLLNSARYCLANSTRKKFRKSWQAKRFLTLPPCVLLNVWTSLTRVSTVEVDRPSVPRR